MVAIPRLTAEQCRGRSLSSATSKETVPVERDCGPRVEVADRFHRKLANFIHFDQRKSAELKFMSLIAFPASPSLSRTPSPAAPKSHPQPRLAPHPSKALPTHQKPGHIRDPESQAETTPPAVRSVDSACLADAATQSVRLPRAPQPENQVPYEYPPAFDERHS